MHKLNIPLDIFLLFLKTSTAVISSKHSKIYKQIKHNTWHILKSLLLEMPPMVTLAIFPDIITSKHHLHTPVEDPAILAILVLLVMLHSFLLFTFFQWVPCFSDQDPLQRQPGQLDRSTVGIVSWENGGIFREWYCQCCPGGHVPTH